MLSGMKLGRVFGVEIRLHASLLIIFGLILVSLGMGVLPAWHPDWGLALTWGVATAASVLFLGSVLLHELGHVLAGRRFGISTDSITLFLFGGMANTEREAPSAKAEFFLAIAGPAVSVVLGVGFSVAASVLARSPELAVDDPAAFFEAFGPVATLLAWLGPINILLAIFNMLPGYPLDGGRVLRAALWALTDDIEKATRWAAAMGRLVGLTFAGLGIAMALGIQVPVLGTGLVNGLWLALIGWFLFQVAGASYQHLMINRSLEHVDLGRMMTTDLQTVSPDLSVDELVHDVILRSEQRGFPVVDESGELVGMVGIPQARKLNRDAWPRTSVASIMTGIDELHPQSPDTDAREALELLAKGDRELPVIENGKLRGLVRQENIARWLELQSPLGGAGRRVRRSGGRA